MVIWVLGPRWAQLPIPISSLALLIYSLKEFTGSSLQAWAWQGVGGLSSRSPRGGSRVHAPSSAERS